MNLKLILRQLGILVILVGCSISSSMVWALLDYKKDNNSAVLFSIIYSVLTCLLVGVGLVLSGNEPDKKKVMYRKEAIAVVGLGWLICGLLGSLPFLLSGVLDSIYPTWPGRIAAAVFESVSGFTTTGASIFPEPESLPRAILFWRSFTHWLGGMGIVVLFVAILSQTGPAAKFMFNSEVPGPKSADSIRPRIRQTAMLLWKIYLGLSLFQTILLMLFGVNIFDSLCHTFGTMGTGGFSTKNLSIGHYSSFNIELIIIVFMIIAGSNFNLYADLITGKWRNFLRNSEFRGYIGIMLVATLIIATDLCLHSEISYSIGRALRSAGFQVVSVMTTTGYGTDDFDLWPNLSRWLLVALMFVGGSAGGTGGGIKVFRLMLFSKLIISEIEKTFRPSLIKPVRLGGQPIDESQCRAIGVYVGLIMVISIISTILLLAIEADIDLETAFSSVVSCLNNIGPGLHQTGPMANYAFMSAPSKAMLTFLMILGRLEVMAIFCLFTPGFWRK